MSKKQPSVTIRLSGPEGNAFAIIAKVRKALEDAGQGKKAQQVLTEFEQLARSPGSVYKDVQEIAETYCHVTWLA
jgi:hypothetical protein